VEKKMMQSSLMNPAVTRMLKQQSKAEGIKDTSDTEEHTVSGIKEPETVKIIPDTVTKESFFVKILSHIQRRHHEAHALPIWVKKLIKVSSLVLFVVSVCISSIFSFMYFNQRNGAIIAGLFVVLIVGSSNLLQTIGLKIMFRSVKSFFIGVVLVCLGAASMVFSMSNTVSALYEGRSQAIIQNAQEQASAEEYELLKQNYQIALQAYQDADRDVKELQDTLDGLDITSKEYGTQRTRLYNSKLYRDDLKEKSDAAFSIMQKKRLTVTAKRDTFELFLGKQLGYTDEQVEFGLSLYPAISADIIAPITLALFLFF
jgi:hypothetical protein